MSEIITKSSPLACDYFKKVEIIATLINRLTLNYNPSLNGERYMTDTELSGYLKITKRTLQEYRNAGIIPYYQIGGKILYREKDIEMLLEKNRREAF